jgi:two-component system cell cycle response regulator DivK
MKSKILVVEDNDLSREMLCDWLELKGFAVDSASSLSEAFAAVERREPDVVLLDVKLGADDGLSLAAWLRLDSTRQRIVVIAVTAHAMLTEQERILRAGCNACISKPIDFPLLLEQLNQWLTVRLVMSRASCCDSQAFGATLCGNGSRR